MEESFVALLLAASGLSALVSARIFWGKAPQSVAAPYVVLSRVSGIPDYHLQGPSGLVQSRVQADCYGTTYASAKGVARQVEARLSGFRGPHGTTQFDGVFKVGERDLYNDDPTPAALHAVSMDFTLWHKEI